MTSPSLVRLPAASVPGAAKPLPPSLDDLELGLIAQLQDDGRRSWRDIARDLGTSESTVSRRARALMASGVLRMTIGIDSQRCGFGHPVLFLIDCAPGRSRDVVQALAQRPDVRFACLVAGDCDVLTEVVVTSVEHLATLLHDEISPLEGIARVRATSVLRTHKMGHRWSLSEQDGDRGDLLEGPLPTEPVELSETDLALMSLLTVDSRASYPKLAADAGLSESVVRRRVEALLASRAVWAIALVDPRALGFEVQLFLHLDVEPAQVDEVPERLGRLAAVRYLSSCVSPGEMLAEVVLRRQQDLPDFYREHLATLPGLRSARALLNVGTYKRGYVDMAPPHG